MSERIFSGTMLTLLFVGTLTLAFNVQHVSPELQTIVDPTPAPSWQIIEAGLRSEWNTANEIYGNVSVPRKLDLRRTEELRCLARSEGDSVELVVGVDVPKLQAQSLKEMIFKKGGKVTSTISMRKNIKIITVLVPMKDVYTFAQELQANGLVKYVEPNFRVEAFFTPNDPYWPDQWGPKKIEADVAWNTTVGSSDILVAILDTGIDYTHADLAANYVPLGYDWVNNDTDPLDDNGHGTHCAGIVAAIINNGIGIAGLAQVHIMAEKVLDLDGFGFFSWVVQGIYHAVDVGAKVISMSFGGSTDSPSIHDAIEYAYDCGVLLVAAAGNEGNSFPNYPAAYDEVIAVSVTDFTDNVAAFSSYGMWIELAAPGVDIYSTLPTYNVTLNEPPFNRTLDYDYLSGTSMACPHVAGVAALAWSEIPNCTHYKIRQILKRTADDLGDVGFDQFYGYGRVNAKRAVVGIPEHDLSISGWRHPSGIHPGEFGMFNATISNYGKNNETNISVQFFVNETLVDVKTIDFLEDEASNTVTFSWGTTAESNYNVTCYVVPVPEENYTENNIASSIVFVRFSLTLKVPSEYLTIKEALNNAAEGDVILVDHGFYSEGQIDIFKNNVTLVAVGNVTLNGLRTKPVLKIVADFVTIEGFNVQNGSCGMYVQGHSNNITGNSILNEGTLNNYCGIHLYKTFDSTICSNTITSIDYSVNVNLEYGILVQSSSNNVISMNNASNAANIYSVICYGKHGIVLYSSSNNIVSFNRVSNSHNGIWIYFSSNNTFISNTATDSWCGILIDASPLNTLRNNNMTNNSANFGVRLDNLGSPSNAINDVDYSNTVNGKPICYWFNRSDASVPSDAGCVVLINCRRIKLQNLTLTYNLHGALLINTNDTQICSSNIMSNAARGWEAYGAGIWMLDSSNNIISKNNISYNVEGVFAYLGVNNTITLNDIVESGKPGGSWGIVIKVTSYCNVSFNKVINTDYGAGICISYSRNNIVDSNSIERGIFGLVISQSDNVISSNRITGCSIGMKSYTGTSNCVIKSNNIIDCKDYAVYIDRASNNIFFYNNFMGNTKVYDKGGYVNVWDNGYPSGGNYWSDYTGVDVRHGPNQDIIGSDGIGDTSYMMCAYNRDHYPLMKPHPWDPHDIGITSMSLSKTVVGQGFDFHINLTIFNYGNNTETLNVAAYANTTILQTRSITLGSRNFTIVTFTWNTTGVAKGNYTMTAKATPIQGETDIDDNTLEGGWIMVAIPSDFDMDNDVDIDDIRYFCEAYTKYWTHPKGKKDWEPPLGPDSDQLNCDLDNDCDIDIVDIRHFVRGYIRYWTTGDL